MFLDRFVGVVPRAAMGGLEVPTQCTSRVKQNTIPVLITQNPHLRIFWNQENAQVHIFFWNGQVGCAKSKCAHAHSG